MHSADYPDWYAKMVLIRAFEEAIGRLFAEGKAPGTTHLSVGQEACAVGAISALRPDDQVFSTHRGHGHFLAKGGDPKLLMAELLGKASGYCRGFGGSQHASYPPIGFVGTNGITGGNIPVATGAALAAQRLKAGRVVMCIFGDGACNQGAFHESLNMAGLWKLPIVYLIENNRYAQWTSIERTTAVVELADRAKVYDMPGAAVDGMDVVAMHEAAQAAVERARQGDGPTLIESKTYRFSGHSKSDVKTTVYRSTEEEAFWKERDPIPAFRAQLLRDEVANEEVLAGLESCAASRIDEAVAFALDAPETDPAQAFYGAYAPDGNAV